MSFTGGGGVRLDSLPRDEVKQLIDSFDNVFTDCDGTCGDLSLFLQFNRPPM